MEIVFTQTQLREIAQQLIKTVPSKIVCFYGDMGAGKTTLIKALVQELGGADTASSPTFGIVNEYHTVHGEILGYHFDFYRLNQETEALDLGLEDYLATDRWIFIEWPEKVPSFLPEHTTDIYLETVDINTRKLRIR
ncbi:MAG: tRNA (adenosine(37)-N6)-threonylcarbamoyltransferase complex ATPase subunit type 1 TsaE [Bacteroidota bacterium]